MTEKTALCISLLELSKKKKKMQTNRAALCEESLRAVSGGPPDGCVVSVALPLWKRILVIIPSPLSSRVPPVLRVVMPWDLEI